ncbi:MAG TPA: acyltransferase [Skermanella sp.]|nr:acyltransferase [Skermanella sp.]
MGSGTKRTGVSIVSIQYLRAVAALLVVFYHAIYQIKEYQGLFEGGIWRFGAAGVDIFFVISGFIMWVTTAARPTTPLGFMRNRVTRIVPMYWIVTLGLFALSSALPNAIMIVDTTPGHLARSLLFIPHADPAQPERLWPLLLTGWTLNYEMFFYGIFACTLLLPRRFMLPAVFAVFLGLTLAGFGGLASGPALSFWTESIVMEFVAGMLVGRLYLDGRLSFSTPASAALVVAGGVLLVAATPWAAPQTRLLAWGLPALMIVIGTLSLEKVSLESRRPPRGKGVLELLGDASYLIYLTHIVTLGALRTLWNMAGLAKPGLPAAVTFIGVATVVCTAVGVAAYAGVEAPVTRAAKRLRLGARRAPALG